MIVTINDYKTDKLLKGPFKLKGELPKAGEPFSYQNNGTDYGAIVKEVEHVLQDMGDQSVAHSAIIYVQVTNEEDFLVVKQHKDSVEESVYNQLVDTLKDIDINELTRIQAMAEKEIADRDKSHRVILQSQN